MAPEETYKLELNGRLIKEAKGSLTTILILGIIEEKDGAAWGYGIKRRLHEITSYQSEIKDSSLYTILKSLELKYGLISSTIKEKRRYYSLTNLGREQYNQACEFWYNLIRLSIEALNTLDYPIIDRIKEELN